MENFQRKYAPIELWSYFIDILAFELGKLCPGVGILFRFFRPRGRSFALKILGFAYTGLDPTGTITKLVRIGLAFTQDLEDPL